MLGNPVKKVIENPRPLALLIHHPYLAGFVPHESKVAAVAPVFLSRCQVRRKEKGQRRRAIVGRVKAFHL